MNIQLFEKILQVLKSVGVEEAVFKPADGGGTKIFAADSTANVIIVDHIEQDLVEMPLGVHSVSVLLTRLRLFDLEKVKVSFDENERHGCVDRIILKQGRRNVTFRCIRPERAMVPSIIPDVEYSVTLQMTKDYANFLNNAFSSIGMTGVKSRSYIAMNVENGQVNIKVHDGDEDSFNDSYETDENDIDTSRWEVVPFQRVMKVALSDRETESTLFTIDDIGMATFHLEIDAETSINVFISPTVE